MPDERSSLGSGSGRVNADGLDTSEWLALTATVLDPGGDPALDAVTRVAVRTLGALHAVVLVREPERDRLALAAADGLDEVEDRAGRLEVARRAGAWVETTREPLTATTCGAAAFIAASSSRSCCTVTKPSAATSAGSRRSSE